MVVTSCGPNRSGVRECITPMIDVLLVLIIVFMVVVSMSQEKGLKAEIPQPNERAGPEPVRTIVVQIGWVGDKQRPKLKINDEEVQ